MRFIYFQYSWLQPEYIFFFFNSMENKNDPWDDDCLACDNSNVTEVTKRDVTNDCLPYDRYTCDENYPSYGQCDDYDDRNYEDYPPYSQYDYEDDDDRYNDYGEQDNEYPFSDEDECIVGKGGGICPCCGGIGDPNGRNAVRSAIFSNSRLTSVYLSQRKEKD